MQLAETGPGFKAKGAKLGMAKENLVVPHNSKWNDSVSIIVFTF